MRTLIVTVMAGALCANGAYAQEGKGEVNRRLENQQDRIQQGENSGNLGQRESNRLERQDGRIAGEVARDRAKNDGRLTGAEKAKVNRQLNRQSGRIFRTKHDGPVH